MLGKEESFWHDGKLHVIEFVHGNENGNLFRIRSEGKLITSMYEYMTINAAIGWFRNNSHTLWR